jgi:hypothetical protein
MTRSGLMSPAVRGDLAVAVVTIAFALLALLFLVPVGVHDPGNINVMALGPAFWPTIISAFLLVMGVLIVVQAWLRARALSSEDDVARPGAGFALWRWVGSLVLLGAYFLALDWLGMVLASIIVLILFMLLGGERRPVLIVVLSLALPLLLFAFFRYVANVVIPLGVLEGLLG